MDEEVSPLEKEHSLSVLLPGGTEKSATVHGSKPVMDLLVTLCASYHLNPSDYMVEVLSPNKNNISFKPNSPIGSLEAEKIVLKPKAGEEKIRTPYMPEATVRLLINYNKSHKAVVRVNPRVPLEKLLPTVCDKCEFRVESTVLLRDAEAKEPLDLNWTLNEHGLREVYAKDSTAAESSEQQSLYAAGTAPTKVSSSSLQDLTKKEKKKSESKGFLTLFRKHRKKSEPTHVVSAPSSPGLTKSRSASVSTQDAAQCATPTADLPKKRRAPLPPMGAFHSFPSNLSACNLQRPQTSAESTLRSTKRRAPPPPLAAYHPEDVHEATPKDSLNPLDEEREPERPEAVGPPPPPAASTPSPSAPLRKGADPQRPTISGKDLSDARAALAKVLTSSLSTGTLVKRLKNTNPFPKVHMDTSSENYIEMRSVLNSNLPTENEFEDPANKTGMTTFRVVPSWTESDAEPAQQVQEETGTEVGTEVKEVIRDDVSDKSERGSPVPCLDEEETTSCPPPSDDHSEDAVEIVKQVEERLNDRITDKIESNPRHESVTNEGKLNLGQEEVVKEYAAALNTYKSKTCDDEIESGHSHDCTANEGNLNLGDKDCLKTHDSKMCDNKNESGHCHESETNEGNLYLSEEEVVKGRTAESKICDDEIRSSPSYETATNKEILNLGEEEELKTHDSKTCDDEIEAGPSHEGITTEGNLNLDEEEELKTCNSKTCDDEIESAPSHERITNEGHLNLGKEEELKTQDSKMCDGKTKSGLSLENIDKGDLYFDEMAGVAQEDDSDSFPPPPPPVYLEDDLDDGSSASVSYTPRAVKNGHMRSISEPPQNVHSAADAERKGSAPSRFAQAVAQAVQRSRLHSTGKTISAVLHQET